MNRNIPPRSGDIRMPVVPALDTTRLPNGVMLHVLRGGTQPVVKVDVLFNAGTLRSDKALVARAVANLMTEGTTTRTSKEIARDLDFYSSSIYGSVNPRASIISLTCLSRDIASVMPIFEDVVKNPTFPSEEVDLYRQQELQQFEVNELRSAVRASRENTRLLYADGDRYARLADRGSFDLLTTENLAEFHKLAYGPAGVQICVSGLPTDDDLRVISEAFGTKWEGGGQAWEAPLPHFRAEAQSSFIDFKGAQTSLRMSRDGFDQMNPDYLPMQIANASLGGYFGSRLMQTLREKMGLTYGVSSYIAAKKGFGVIGVSSEINAGSHEKVVEVVKEEMRRLATEPIPDKEIDVIRSVMHSDLLRYFDSVFTSADTLFSFVTSDIPTTRVAELYDVIKNVSAVEVRDVAARWFVPEKFNVVCVGPMG